VGLASTLSLFTVQCLHVLSKNGFFGRLAFSSQPELFEIALIGWKKAKLPKNQFCLGHLRCKQAILCICIGRLSRKLFYKKTNDIKSTWLETLMSQLFFQCQWHALMHSRT